MAAYGSFHHCLYKSIASGVVPQAINLSRAAWIVVGCFCVTYREKRDGEMDIFVPSHKHLYKVNFSLKPVSWSAVNVFASIFKFCLALTLNL